MGRNGKSNTAGKRIYGESIRGWLEEKKLIKEGMSEWREMYAWKREEGTML